MPTMAAPHRFCRYELRTTDLVGAQAFYADVLGLDVLGAVSQLPDRAAARGAPAHWLGHIAVDDVEAMANRMIALGGERLGLPRPDVSILRDPFGAVVGLSASIDASDRIPVVWHERYTPDRARTWAMYAELFGWSPTETLDLGPTIGAYQLFAWDAVGPSVGGMIDIAGLPGVHSQWCFYFGVDDLDAALARVRARGGIVANGPTSAPGGDRVAQCDDPQGAAFGLREVTRRATSS